jgi:hypothetical protein
VITALSLDAPLPACPSTGRHGTSRAYRHDGCRCPTARRAATKAAKIYMIERGRNGGPLKVDSTGTRRRIEALMAIGWPGDELARRLGVTRGALYRTRRRTTSLRGTQRRVADLYEALADVRGPSRRTEGRSRALGYEPPIAWDDDTIDDPAARPAKWRRSTAGGTDRQRRLARTAANGGIAPIARHDVATYNNWGCRCPTCTTAKADWWAGYTAARRWDDDRAGGTTLVAVTGPAGSA